MDFVEIVGPNDKPSPSALAAAMTGDVCAEIERRNLSYARNLECYWGFGMPWMQSIHLHPFPPNMGKADKLKVATFLSCVGMIQNGDYVSYEELRTLLRELPRVRPRCSNSLCSPTSPSHAWLA